MKGLKYITLFFIAGCALLVQLVSPNYVHADGIKTPLPGFTPFGIGTPPSTGVPARIYFAENTLAAMDSSTPNPPSNTPLHAPKDSPTLAAQLHTSLPPRINSPASTPTKSTEPTIVSVSPVRGTPTVMEPASRSTLFAVAPNEHQQSKPSGLGQPTMTTESRLVTSVSGPVEVATSEGAQKPTLSDVLQVLPENTDVIVLAEGEKPLALASQEAAQVISQSDPVWCPAGQVPTPGANGCTVSYATLAALVANEGMNIGANGTIWITSGPQSLETGPITIDGLIYTNWANSSLTLQGGWTGTTIGPNSVFNVPIHILNWNADVAINNITVENASGSGLGVTTNGSNVTIRNSRFLNNQAGTSSSYFPWGDGADIVPNGGNVTIENSEFTGNSWDGLFIVNSYNISITNSRINSNGRTVGGGLNASNVINTINITNSEFTGNLSYDIYANCYSGGSLIVSYPDNIPPFPTPVRMDIEVDSNCRARAFLVLPTPTPTLAFTPTLTPTGPTPTATATPTGPTRAATGTATSSPPSSTLPTPTRFPINPATPTPGFTPTSIPTRIPPTVQPRSTLVSGSSARPKSKGEFFLDCKLQQSFTYPLPNGDKVEIVCPSGYWSGKATISRLDNTTLPDELPAGFKYASAFVVNISKLREPAQLVGGEFLREEVNVIPEGGYIKTSFVALGQENYSILYWDEINSRWIPLKDFMLDEKGKPQVFDLYPEDPDNLLKIVSGVQQVSNPLDPRVEVSTNFPGIFVLAQH